MSIFNVNSSAALQTALNQAKAGDVIRLAAGDYAGLSIQNIVKSGNVTITSADPKHPAVLKQFSMGNCKGITFSHVAFSSVGSTDPYYVWRVTACQNVNFDSVTVQGDTTIAPSKNPFCAFFVRDSSGVSFTNSSFSNLNTAIYEQNSDHTVFSGNAFSAIGLDGIESAQVSFVTISNNTFTDFMPPPGAHPDAIQFWTQGTTSASHDISITGNLYVRGPDPATSAIQGIFIKDELGTLPYTNVTIAGNDFLGSMYNGIYLLDVKDGSVTDNKVAGNADMLSWISLDDTVGLSLRGNVAQAYQYLGENLFAELINRISDAYATSRSVGGTVSGDVERYGLGDYVLGGGRLSAANVKAGQSVEVFSGGATLDTVVASGGRESVRLGGAASGGSVQQGAVAVLWAGGSANSVTVSAGATLVLAGEVIGGGKVITAGAQAAAGASSGVLLQSGAVVDVLSATVSNGGQARILSGGEAAASLVVSGGVETVLSGGITSGATILGGGIERVWSGGGAVGARVGQGGRLAVLRGGVASADVVLGGLELVHGAAKGDLVLSGGVERICGGAIGSGVIIGNGGKTEVLSNGAMSAPSVLSGGTLVIASGGVLGGGLRIDGGLAVIFASGLAGQVVDFGKAGELRLADPSHFEAAISGMTTASQTVDLAGFAYAAGETVSWTQQGTSGSLVITDGSKTAALTLIGTYVTSDFRLASDGHGGTLIFDPPSNAATRQMAQATAGMGGRRQAAAPPARSDQGANPSAAILAAVVSGR